MKKENAPRRSSERKQSELQDISTVAQQQRLLAGLREAPVTTLEARQQFDVMHPAGRVKELRAQCFNILTLWRTVETVPGVKHRVARYALIPGSHQGRAA